MNNELLKNKTSFLFDFDGTLVDSSCAHESAFLQAMQKNEPSLQKDFCYENWKGHPSESVFRSMGVGNEALVQKLTSDKQAFYRHQVEIGLVQLMPSATELLDYLAGIKSRLFIVTSASRRSLDTALVQLGIEHFFEGTVSGDDIPRAKPAPDCYLKCLEMSRSALVDSIVIEDARAGVDAARAAGLDVVIVNNKSLSEHSEYLGSLLQLKEHLLALQTNQ